MFRVVAAIIAILAMGLSMAGGCQVPNKTKVINIAQGDHDGEYVWSTPPLSIGAFDNSGNDLLVYRQIIGIAPTTHAYGDVFLFYRLGIPKYSEILTATIKITGSFANGTGPWVRIFRGSQLDIAPPTTAQEAYDLTLDPNYIDWNHIPAIGIGETAESPDITRLITESMGLSGYNPASLVLIKINGYSLVDNLSNGTQFSSLEGGSGPQLIITYTPAGGGGLIKTKGRKWEKTERESLFEAMRVVSYEEPAPEIKEKALEDQFIDFPASLRNLLIQFAEQISKYTNQLSAGDIGVDIWFNELQKLLIDYHLAAYMAGQDSPLIGETEEGHVWEYTKAQIEFLENFKIEVQAAEEFKRGWLERAKRYATSIVAPYWKGKTKILPLPAMPGDLTTPCGQMCACGWDINQLREETEDYAGDWDCYWKLDQFRIVETEHCQICSERSEQWNPLRIRDGRIEIPEAYLKQFHFDEYHGHTEGEARRIVTKVIQDLDFLASVKHLPGGHDQKRHGWRYGAGNVKRTFRNILKAKPYADFYNAAPGIYTYHPELQEYKRRVRLRNNPGDNELAYQAAVYDFEQRSRLQGRETAIFLDRRTGEAVTNLLGEEKRVVFGDEVVERANKKTNNNTILVHNHPSGRQKDPNAIYDFTSPGHTYGSAR